VLHSSFSGGVAYSFASLIHNISERQRETSYSYLCVVPSLLLLVLLPPHHRYILPQNLLKYTSWCVPAIPHIPFCTVMGLFTSKRRDETEKHAREVRDAKFSGGAMDKSALKRATRPRMIWCIITSLLLLISVIFLILVEIGNTSKSGALPNIYFIKLDLSHVFPTTIPNSNLLNSIAQTLGLHDFYQVGLWNYCEGYNGQGATACSKTQALYWFNPVAIIANELVAGASGMF